MAGQRRPKETQPKETKSFSRRDLMLTALGAIGGAALTTVGSIIVEKIRWQHAKAEETTSKLEELAQGYTQLGDVTRRAGEYAEQGTGGPQAVDDVRAVWRYLSGAVRTAAASGIPEADFARRFGTGTMQAWAYRFELIGGRGLPQGAPFSQGERHDFMVLSNSLRTIQRAGEAAEAAEGSGYGNYLRDANTVQGNY